MTWVCALTLTFWCVTAMADTTRATIDVGAIVSAMFRPPPDLAPLKAQMREAREGAEGKQRQILTRTLEVVEAVEHDPAWMTTHFDDVVQLVRDYADSAPDDVGTQRQMVATFLGLPALASSFERDPAPLREEGLTRARRLAARFSSDGRVHGVLASALAQSGAEASAVARAYKKCAELDPAAAYCVEGLARARTELQAPRCAKLKPNFVLCGGAPVTDETPRSARRVTQSDVTIALDGSACLKASDVSAATLRGEAVSLAFRRSSATKLEGITRRLAASFGFMAILDRDETLLVARVTSVIANGMVEVRAGREAPVALLERLCDGVERPALPPDLR